MENRRKPPPRQQRQSSGGNGLAITSLIVGVLSWLLALAMLIVNFVIVPIFTLGTLGLGAFLYICTIAISCFSPLGWLIGVVTGYVSKNQAKGTDGEGIAKAGYIINMIGIVLTILSLCLFLVLPLLGISIPILSDPSAFGY